jgi:hypothetical protein
MNVILGTRPWVATPLETALAKTLESQGGIYHGE